VQKKNREEYERLTALGNLASKNGITRREFLASASILGVSLTTAQATWSSIAKAAGPKKGGSVKFGVTGGSSEDTLDPTYAPDTAVGLVWMGIRNCLTEVKENGDLAGELAESWEPSPDAKSWTFKIRKGVEFHSGKTLTAQDVALSIRHHMGENSKSHAKGLTKQISDIKVSDPQTITFALDAGNADFPWIMSAWSFQILPSKDESVDWQSGDGTGGYKLKNFQPGVSTELDRSSSYWKGVERAHFDHVEVINVADVAARETALITKELDAITRPDLKTLDKLSESKGIRVLEVPSSQYSSIPMDVRVAPFDNNDVRMALKYAIDRDQLVKTVLFGHGLPANDNPIGPTYRYYAADIEKISYDPDKAKFHLKKAGHDKLSIQLKTAPGAWPAGPVDAALLYREHAKKAGIDIEISRESDDGYWSNVWLKAAFCMSYVGGRPTADWIFQQYFAGTSEYNESHWKDDRFDKLLLDARTELDDTKRREIYREMQVILRDNCGTMIPLFTNQVAALHDNVATGDTISGNWEFDNWRAVERWWSI
jgi:peptide/nickel transport system substrate-binding protein